MNRGSFVRRRSAPPDLGCFNEAPIHESGKSLRRSALSEVVQVASMRPRFMNRGSRYLDDEWVPRATASMRPRFMNRGSPHCRHPT